MSLGRTDPHRLEKEQNRENNENTHAKEEFIQMYTVSNSVSSGSLGFLSFYFDSETQSRKSDNICQINVKLSDKFHL